MEAWRLATNLRNFLGTFVSITLGSTKENCTIFNTGTDRVVSRFPATPSPMAKRSQTGNRRVKPNPLERDQQPDQNRAEPS